MISVGQDPAQRASDAVALVLTAALLSVMLVTKSQLWRQTYLPAGAGAPSIALSIEPAPPAAAVPAKPAPTPQKVPKRQAPPQQSTPPAPEATLPMRLEQAPPDGALLTAAVMPAGNAPPADSRPDLEAQYAAAVRTDIERRRHPPDSAQYRLHRPFGEVRVRFVLTRAGEPLTVGVTRSSGSPILDKAAVAIVASGHYGPMPAKAYSGEEQHTFAATIEFPPPT